VKVAVLGPLYPYRGGIAHYNARLCRALVDEGHDVCAVNLTRQYPAALFPGTTQEDASKSAFEFPAERLLDSLDPLSWARTLRHIRRCAPDVLVVQWWHPYFAASFGAVAYGARAMGIRVVFVAHNVLPHESSPADRLLAKFAYRAASRFVVHARAEEARVRALVRRAEVAVNPHPVYDHFDTDAAPSQQEARAALGVDAERVLLFFGLIRPYKGLDVLLDAMPAIVERTGATLLIAGECYEGLEEYERQIDRLGIGAHVRLDARYVANEEVPTLMAAADAVVLPYRHATQSGVVQVAYGCGRPVITSAVGGIPEVVWEGETGLLVPPEDPPALADAVTRFYEEDLAETMQAGIARHIEELGWPGMVRAILGT
jgi:glycosyltransferase involved in cell wall biosynthesis